MNKSENQNIEFKENWRDEYLKTICSFANARGGKLYIGLDDKGYIKGISDAKKLLEDIPNKIKEMLGVIADVSIKKKSSKEYIEIKIESYKSPISFKGKYYVRSGSTTQELNGLELQKFHLEKSNISWESVIEENASLKDIDQSTVDSFRARAKEKLFHISKEKRLNLLLNKLHLLSRGKPTRAAILLFGKDPQQFYSGSYTKIGSFSSDDVLISSDVINGNLFEQAERSMEILKNKYLKSQVIIEGLYRKSDLEYPELALREAIINSIAHREYESSHVQIKVYSDKLVFWNPGELSKNLTIELLKKKHPSHPRNRLIADIFYKSGLIEAWGSGTMKMIKECTKVGLPEPVFEEYAGGMQVIFSKDIYSDEYIAKLGLNERQIICVNYLKKNSRINNQKYQEVTGAVKRTASRDLAELIEKKVIEKSGKTGKGTSYHIKGLTLKNTQEEKPTKSTKDWDSKLSILDKQLEVFDPDEELKIQFSGNILLEIFDTWLTDLIKELIPIIQKFNKYFINPGHYINLPNGIGGVKFINEDARELIPNIRHLLSNNLDKVDNYEKTFNVYTSYGSFKKVGFDTFGCNYSIVIKFSQDWYEIQMDDEVMKRNQKLQFKRQYHKPMLKTEIKELSERFGEVIFQHITQAVSRIQQKKT